MLRLIHAQTVQGSILVDDIDDGLPNKEVHRLGSTADPKAYKRDGYANEPKQKCYIPRTKPGNAAIAGYIDLNETSRVTLSAGKGKISKLQTAGLVTVVSFLASDLTTPVISGNTRNSPGAGDTTIAGTNFLSVSPNITSVRLFGAGVGNVTLTSAQIITGTGTVSNTSIVIKAAQIAGLAAGDHIIVTSDDKASNSFLVT